MSALNVANLPRITAPALASLLKSPQASSVAVIDVRDDDYIGGHIRNCQHVPSSTLDWRTPELVQKLKDKDIVVFHCMLCQQRGPTAALRYARERQRLLGEEGGAVEVAGEQNAGKGDKIQKVCILERGFGAWVQQFARDETLTEGYRKDVWEV